MVTMAETPRSAVWTAALVAGVTTLGLIGAFAQTFAEMWLRWFPAWRYAHWSLYQRFTGGEGYYTHGLLVPLISVVIAAVVLRHVTLQIRPSRWAGPVVLGVGILMHLTGCLARVNFLSALALVVVLAGLTLSVLGRQGLRTLAFPLAFLLLMVPLPEVSLAQINFRLKMLAADWGVFLAELAGTTVERAGNTVLLAGGGSLVVANVCNGLRTIVSLIGFAALYAYVCRLRGPWRLGLFAMAVPVAVASNAVRVAVLILVAAAWGTSAATGWFHDASGVTIYGVAFLGMFGLEGAFLIIHRPANRSGSSTSAPQGSWASARAAAAAFAQRPARIAAAALMVTAVASLWLNRSADATWLGQTVQQVLPDAVQVQGKQWQGHDQTLDDRTLAILETRDYIFRRYVSAGTAPLDVCIVFSQDNRKSTHPPDLCLEGGANTILEKSERTVTRSDGRGDIACAELVSQSGAEKTYHLYVYKCGQKYTRSFWSQQLGIFVNGLLGRDTRGALLRVSTVLDVNSRAAKERSATMIGLAANCLDRALDR